MRIPSLESSVILRPPCFRAGEGCLQLSFALSIQRQTAGMQRGVYSERSERDQHGSTQAQPAYWLLPTAYWFSLAR
jgi:hypothetical protein